MYDTLPDRRKHRKYCDDPMSMLFRLVVLYGECNGPSEFTS